MTETRHGPIGSFWHRFGSNRRLENGELTIVLMKANAHVYRVVVEQATIPIEQPWLSDMFMHEHRVRLCEMSSDLQGTLKALMLLKANQRCQHRPLIHGPTARLYLRAPPKIREPRTLQSACAGLSISVSSMIRWAHTIDSMSPIPRLSRAGRGWDNWPHAAPRRTARGYHQCHLRR